MKKNEIKIGQCYEAKVSNRIATVRIDSAHSKQGWNATNTATGKRVHIKSAQRLRRAIVESAAINRSRKPTSEPPGLTPGEQGVAAARADAKAAERENARARKAAEPKPRRASALNAAAEVLRTAEASMNCTSLIKVMAERKLWASPNGKTPHATLAAAILREIKSKGAESRFKKVGPGLFVFNG